MRYIRIYFVLFLLGAICLLGCNRNDAFNLVGNDALPFLSYSVKLTAPTVTIDSMAYTVVEKQDEMWFVSFDAKGDIDYLSNVSSLYSGDFDIDELAKVEYFGKGGYFYGLLGSGKAQDPVRLFVMEPSSGNLVNVITPLLKRDTNVISQRFVALLPMNPDMCKYFVFSQFKDSLNVYHQQLIKYDCSADTLISVDSVSLDTLENITVWNQFIVNGGNLYFYLVENYGIDDRIYEFCYDPQADNLTSVQLGVHYLPITYVPIDNQTIFTTVHAEEHVIYPAVYSFKQHNFIASLPLSKFENFLITNKIRVQDTDYIVGFTFKRVDEINFAKYDLIFGDYMMLRYNYADLLTSPQTTAIIYTKLQDFKNFSPYGLIDNGQGFTIIGKGDAFSYFPATIVLKTDYSGKPIKAYYERRR